MNLLPKKNKPKVPDSKASTRLLSLRDAVNRLFDFDESLWHQHPLGIYSKNRYFDSFFSDAEVTNLIAVDFSETDKYLLLEADVPGFNSNDLNIELEDSVLTISGHKQDTQEKETKTYHLQERSTSQFSRSFALPAYADLDKVECNLKGEKLTVQIGKMKDATQKKTLPIQ